MTDHIEEWLKQFEHRGKPPSPEDVEKLIELVRVYREANKGYARLTGDMISIDDLPQTDFSVAARYAEEQAKKIIEWKNK